MFEYALRIPLRDWLMFVHLLGLGQSYHKLSRLCDQHKRRIVLCQHKDEGSAERSVGKLLAKGSANVHAL